MIVFNFMGQLKDENFIKGLKSHWVIIVFFLGLAVTWGTMLTKISNIETRLDKTEIQQQLSATSIQAIRESQARIETKLEFILQQ